MKRVLITGASGFIGAFLVQNLEGFEIKTLSLRNPDWINQPLECDVIIHCAGIAHVSKKIDEFTYYKINYELTVELAQKAKKEGVEQFVFLSSQLIYGVGHIGEITKSTYPSPQNGYGRSKWIAEIELAKLSDPSFLVACLRLPLVYGMSPKGNLKTLMSLSKLLFVFPKVENKRSVISLSSICSHIKEIIEHGKNGSFNVSDSVPVTTYEIIRHTRSKDEKRTLLISFANPVIKLLRKRVNLFGKVFGDAYFQTQTERLSNETIFTWIDEVYGEKNER
jgi:UDP-glucose 4-epimerase